MLISIVSVSYFIFICMLMIGLAVVSSLYLTMILLLCSHNPACFLCINRPLTCDLCTPYHSSTACKCYTPYLHCEYIREIEVIYPKNISAEQWEELRHFACVGNVETTTTMNSTMTNTSISYVSTTPSMEVAQASNSTTSSNQSYPTNNTTVSISDTIAPSTTTPQGTTVPPSTSTENVVTTEAILPEMNSASDAPPDSPTPKRPYEFG